MVLANERGCPDHIGEVLGAAVPQIVPIDRGDHHVFEAELRDAVGDMLGLVRVERPGRPVFTLQNAQARVQVSPMIMKVACFFSQHSPILGHPASSRIDGDELVLAHDPVRFGPLRRARRLHPDPVRLALDGLVGPMRLLRMAGPVVLVQQIENDGHELPQTWSAVQPTTAWT